MKIYYENATALIILLFVSFLSSCATKSAIAKIPFKGISSDSYIITETKDKSNIVDKINSPEETHGSTKEETTPLKDVPEIDEGAQSIQSNRATGNDDLAEQELKRIMLEFGEEDEEILQVFLGEVKRYIRSFQINPQYRKFVIASLKRSSKYLPLVKTVFNQRGIPEDMAYIAFIESGFNPKALSHAGALGVWQFMPQTARNYSLRVSRSIDERLDPIKSTYAAVDYFHDLIAIFGPRSFLLAIAAYNCGEGKIISCLKEIDNPFEERNFWHIRSCLNDETREYPPKVIASAIIGNNPEAFGFPKFEINEKDIISPALLAEYKPVENSEDLAPELESVQVRTHRSGILKKSQYSKTKVSKPMPVLYTVKTGNTLTSLAAAFNVETGEIKRWNKLNGDKILSGMRLTIYPKSLLEMVRYTVKKRETLTEISEEFGVRPSHIISCNGMTNGWDIKAGQKLTFYRKAREKPIIYTVIKGSNLTNISEAYKVEVTDIMGWNNLSSTVIYPGQKLKIYAERSRDI